jgi:polar amino acid transport system substrate-binding protein
MRRPLLAVPLLLALGLAACSDKKTTEPVGSKPTASAATATALAAMLPADVKAAGKLTVASDVAYPPIEFFEADGTTITGIDYDLGQAIGAKLGLPVEFTNQTFDGIIPALQAKKFDLVMSAMTDNTKRQKVLDFVDYFSAGTSIVVKKGNPQGIKDFGDLCGKIAAAEKGTIQVDEVLVPESKKCTDAGKPAITIKALPKDTDALLAVKSGQAVADVNDSPVAAYTVSKAPNDFESVLSEELGTSPYGIGVLKGRDELVKAIQLAVQELIADGTYLKILNKYGAAEGAIATATINGGTS